MMNISDFEKVLFIKFAIVKSPGERVEPIAFCSYELKSNNWHLSHNNETITPTESDEQTLVIGYDMSNDLACFHQLNWPIPQNVIDLRAEYRCLNSGLSNFEHDSFVYTLHDSGINFIPVMMSSFDLIHIKKNSADTERICFALRKQIESQVCLYDQISGKMNVTQALARGRYVKAVAAIEQNGIPIDTVAYEQIKENWNEILLSLIQDYDKIGVYDGTTFKAERFFKYLSDNGISWPKNKQGKLILKLDEFEKQAISHAEIASIYQVRKLLSQLRTFELPIGQDGRNRFNLRPFTAKTSRNQPRSSECIFGLSSWVRHLIKPQPGKAIAYIDWSQQEFGIGAALSQDENMLTAYQSGDPYLAFGKQINKIPADGTKQSHSCEREICKQCILGVQYGMEAWSLSKRIGCDFGEAESLLNLHKQTYAAFWQWSDSFVAAAKERGYTESLYGWRLNVNANSNQRSLRNFPMQANGAEMLRMAANLVVENGIQVCCLVHDAILIEANENDIDSVIALTQEAMRIASRKMLNGLELRTDVQITRYPDRFETDRGKEIWNDVISFLEAQRSMAA